MRLLGVTFGAVVCLLLAQTATAGDCGKAPDCCAQCGDKAPCQPKTCRVVCGVKKVKKYCWQVKCEEFCLPMPGCRKSASGCGAVDECDPGCGPAKAPTPPKCGKVRCRKKLVKKEYTVEVPIYKCVVKNVCGECCEPSGDDVIEEAMQPPSENRRQTIEHAPLPPTVTATAYRKEG